MRVDEGPERPDDGGRADADAGPSRPARTTDEIVATEAFATFYVSPRERRLAARNAVIAASTGAAVLGAACAFAWVQLRRAADDVRGGRAADVSDLRLPRADEAVADRVGQATDLVDAMTVVSFVTLLVAAYYVVRWQSDALRQQRALGIVEPRFSPTKAGWSWFVPVWSLFGPKQAFNDLWRASEPGAPARAHDRSWLRRRTPRLLTAWWAAWLLGSLLGAPVEVVGDDGTLGSTMDDLLVAAVGCVALVVAGVLFLLVMDAIVVRSDRRADELGLRGLRGTGR